VHSRFDVLHGEYIDLRGKGGGERQQRWNYETDHSSIVTGLARFAAPLRVLLKHVDVAPRAHLFQDLGPDTYANLAQVRLAQEQHQGSRLPNASADA